MPSLAERWIEEEGFGTPAPTTEGVKYDPRELRGPDGRWISAGDSVGIPGLDTSGDTSNDAALIEDAIAQSEQTTGDPDPGPTVPQYDPGTAFDEVEGISTWNNYLLPNHYQQVQDVARGLKHDQTIEKGLTSLEERGIPDFGKSRKGAETWRVTSLHHLSSANKGKLAEHKPFTVTEKGLLSLATDRQGAEFVGTQTHDPGTAVELHIKVKTNAKALDSLQSEQASSAMGGDGLLSEYVYPRGQKLRFTGQYHVERRPFFNIDDPYADSTDPASWTVKPIMVYDVEAV